MIPSITMVLDVAKGASFQDRNEKVNIDKAYAEVQRRVELCKVDESYSCSKDRFIELVTESGEITAIQ